MNALISARDTVLGTHKRVDFLRVIINHRWSAACSAFWNPTGSAAPSSGPGSLTPSERRVVDVAAGGATNRDIAPDAVHHPKTVELHLSNPYRKLGIASRRRLADALAAT
jgi:DNA-binding NarL/FixJ family response regulator